MQTVNIWSCDIRWSNSRIRHIVATIRISRSFLWNAMNDLMYVMQLWLLGIWTGHFSHLPKLNYRCKIKYLQGTMENATLRQNFSHSFSPLNGFLSNHLDNILSFSKSHNCKYLARSSNDPTNYLKHSLKVYFHIDNRKRKTKPTFREKCEMSLILSNLSMTQVFV